MLDRIHAEYKVEVPEEFGYISATFLHQKDVLLAYPKYQNTGGLWLQV